ncbi:MAG: hypothetical protein LBN95_10620 [Prevotellaceae bacterium]|jgi:hypothetical protein|nr:hypothetical protein [Prevotellaceae bacterium]
MYGLFYYHSIIQEDTFIVGFHSENLEELKIFAKKSFFENEVSWEIWEQDKNGLWGNSGSPILSSETSGFNHSVYYENRN